jgi:alpha-glucosidase
VFEDAQDGYDYTKGRYALRTFTLTGKEKNLVIRQHKEGKYITPYSNFKINLTGLPFTVQSIEVDNEAVSLEDLKLNIHNTLTISKDFSELHIKGI